MKTYQDCIRYLGKALVRKLPGKGLTMRQDYNDGTIHIEYYEKAVVSHFRSPDVTYLYAPEEYRTEFIRKTLNRYTKARVFPDEKSGVWLFLPPKMGEPNPFSSRVAYTSIGSIYNLKWRMYDLPDLGGQRSSLRQYSAFLVSQLQVSPMDVRGTCLFCTFSDWKGRLIREGLSADILHIMGHARRRESNPNLLYRAVECAKHRAHLIDLIGRASRGKRLRRSETSMLEKATYDYLAARCGFETNLPRPLFL